MQFYQKTTWGSKASHVSLGFIFKNDVGTAGKSGQIEIEFAGLVQFIWASSFG